MSYAGRVKFDFDPQYGERLYDARRVDFDDALAALYSESVLFEFPQPEKAEGPNRNVLVVAIAGVAYFVPYEVDGNRWLLRTVYPAKQFKQLAGPTSGADYEPAYLNDEERQVVESLRRVNPKFLSRPSASRLSKLRRSAARCLKHREKGSIRISWESIQQAREHAGKMGSQTGVLRQW